LKNDGVRQWEEWHPIYEMENKKMFQTTNQIWSSFAGWLWLLFFSIYSLKHWRIELIELAILIGYTGHSLFTKHLPNIDQYHLPSGNDCYI